MKYLILALVLGVWLCLLPRVSTSLSATYE